MTNKLCTSGATFALLAALSALAAGPAFAAKESSKDDAVSAGGTKVALIRMQEAIKDTKDGKKAEERLKTEVEKRQKTLQAEGEKIQKAMEDLRKQGMVMDEKTRQEKEVAIQKQMQAFEASKMSSQQEFQKLDQEISEPIIKKIRSIVAQVSKDKGYTLVIDTGSVIYANDQDDITDEVIKRYDSKK
jgi:outer membrane protein